MPLKRSMHEVSESIEPVAYTAHGETKYRVDFSITIPAGVPVRRQRRGFPTRGAAILWAEEEIVRLKRSDSMGEAPANSPAPASETRRPPEIQGGTATKDRRTTPAPAARVMTDEAVDRVFAYWGESGRKKESTCFVEYAVACKHLLPSLGDTVWSELSQAQVDELIRGARNMPTPHHLTILRGAIRDSRRAGLLAPDVIVDVPRRPTRYRTDYITVDELDLICAHAKPLWAAVFRFLFHTGLRVGEMLALEHGDFDLRENRETVTVRRRVYPVGRRFSVGSPKNGQHRTVPLNASAVAALAAIRSQVAQEALPSMNGRARLAGASGGPEAPLAARLILPSGTGGYRRQGQVRYELGRACKAAGFRCISPHILRHSFGSNLAMANTNIYAISTLMGHSSVTMTARYAHLAEDGLRASACVLDTLARKVN